MQNLFQRSAPCAELQLQCSTACHGWCMRCLIDIEAEVEVVFDVEQSNEPARAQSVHYDTVRSKYTSVFCFSMKRKLEANYRNWN